MTKQLEARKVKGGWLITVQKTFPVITESQVLDVARYEGLTLKDKTDGPLPFSITGGGCRN
jgi:hypothetical protein